MGEFIFVVLGATTFAVVMTVFLFFWLAIVYLVVGEIRRLRMEKRLRKARAEILDREKLRIAQMIQKKAGEEEWLAMLANIEDETENFYERIRNAQVDSHQPGRPRGLDWLFRRHR